MRKRPVIVVVLLVPVLLLIIAYGILPRLAAGQICQLLVKLGYDDPVVERVSVGLHELQAGPISCREPEPLAVASVAATYDPVQLLTHHQLKRVRVAGARVSVPASGVHARSVVGFDPEALPFARLSFADSMLIFDRDVRVDVHRGEIMPHDGDVHLAASLSVIDGPAQVEGRYGADGQLGASIEGREVGFLNALLETADRIYPRLHDMRVTRCGYYRLSWDGRGATGRLKAETRGTALSVSLGHHSKKAAVFEWEAMAIDAACSIGAPPGVHGMLDVSNLVVDASSFSLGGMSGRVPIGVAPEDRNTSVGELRIDAIALGHLVMTGAVVRCGLGMDGTLHVSEVTAHCLGGVVRSLNLDIALDAVALDILVHMLDLELGEVLALVAPERMAGHGALSGHWNLRVQMKPEWRLRFGSGYLDSGDELGWFRVKGPVNLADVLGERAGASSSPGLHERIAAAIGNFRYRDLSVVMSEDSGGELLARVHTSGRGPARDKAEPITFGGLTFNLRGLDDLFRLVIAPRRDQRPADGGETAPHQEAGPVNRAIDQFF